MTDKKPKITANEYMALNAMMSRYGMTRDVGDLFGGILQGGYHGADTFRNTWVTFGYPFEIPFSAYWNMYCRGGISGACVVKPVKKRWSSYPSVYDEPFEEDGKTIDRSPTEFESAVQRLVDEFDLWGVLKELDECQRVGQYGAILIAAKEKEKVDNIGNTPLFAASGIDSLISLTPCFQSQIDFSNSNVNDDMSSVRFGLPENYQYKEGAGIIGSRMGNHVSIDQKIHWTRAFVFSESARGNGIIGRPMLMNVFNSLMDFYKTGGSSSEGHYKNAKQRIGINITDASMAALAFSKKQGSDSESEIDKELKEYDAGFNNYLKLAGAEAKVLQAAIADPTGPAGLALQDICSWVGIPKTELIGFETGERSSGENANAWNNECQGWRTTTGTKLVTRFFKHLVEVKILPPPKNNRIMVDWPDLAAATIERRVDNAGKLSPLITALNNAGKTGAIDSIVDNLLPDVLDIEIETEPTDNPDDGRDDADTED